MAGNIRKLEPEDRSQWDQLWSGYQTYYEVDLSAEADELYRRLMNPDADGPYCLVYEEDGKLLGLTQYLFHQSTWSKEPRCYLHDLYTLPDHRGKRIGEKLIHAVEAAANAHGSSSVYWMTQDFNHTARKLYDRVGKLTPFIKYSL